MAEKLISTLTINGNTYTLKDAVSRSLLESLPTTSATLTPYKYINHIYNNNGKITTVENAFKSSINPSTDSDMANAPSARAVVDYVSDILSNYTSISFEVTDGDENGPTLTASADTFGGTFYLVSCAYKNSKSTYDEWITLKASDGTYYWERIGSTDVDLSQYVKNVTVQSTSFKGTAGNHSHNVKGSTAVSTMTDTISVSIPSQTASFTPSGSVEYNEAKVTTGDFLTKVTAKIKNATDEGGDLLYPTKIMRSVFLTDTYTESSENLSVGVDGLTVEASNWSITITPTSAKAITGITSVIATFKGTESDMTIPKNTGTFSSSLLNHSHSINLNTSEASITPEGTVTVSLDVTKGSNTDK